MAKQPMMRDREEIKKARPKRTPLFEQRDQMAVEAKPGFVRRWVNDLTNRIEKFRRAGWEIVSDKEVSVGSEGVVDNNVSLGSGARKNVGRTRGGDNSQAVLMEIPQELYEEDQRAKQASVTSREEAIYRDLPDKNFYGDIKSKAGYAKKKSS